MSSNLESIILDFLSQNEVARKKADSLMTSFFNSMNISDLSNFYSILKTSQDNNVKIYISIFIKNYIEQKITSENRDEFIQYINTYKYEILNIILNANLEKKTINLLIISLCKGLSFFQVDMKSYNKIVYELCSYIFQYYKQQKKSNNENINITRTLFICSKFIKYIDKDIKNIHYENIYIYDKYYNNIKDKDNNDFDLNGSQENNFENLNFNFYNEIVEDYDKLYQTINKNNNNINNEQIYDYIILYLKIFKYSLNYLEMNNREKILDINYHLIICLFNKLININNNNNQVCLNNYFNDILSLSNKIIVNYLSTHIVKITLNTIKNYSSFFYSFISDENLLSSLENIFNTKNNKFIIDIIEFLYKLIDLVYTTFPEYATLCKENKNNFKEITEYINKYLFTKENTKLILSFIIQKCLIFNDNEIYMAQESSENFYLCFTEYSSFYDIKTISGNLCNLMYTIFRKKYLDIFKFFESNLISLTTKENQLLQINQDLSGDELNLKCALLLFFYYLEDYYNLNIMKNSEIIEKVFLWQIDEEIIIKKGKEIFSTFIIIRILTKILSMNFGQKNFKKKIIEKILKIFFSEKIKETLIELACYDMFNEYIENEPMMISSQKEKNNIFPEFFIQNYLIKISVMINKISSPELHSKILETTNNIINILDKSELNLDFNIIIPFLELIWVNKYNNETKNDINDYGLLNKKNKDIKIKNKIYIVRRDLVKLINIIIKKIGFYTYNNENKINSLNNNNFAVFHEFIYQIINYTLNQSSSEEKDYLYPEIFNLLILIQDNFSESISLSTYKNINDIRNINLDIQKNQNYIYFCKFYDFFNQIFEQASNCENNIYLLAEIFVIEQFIPFCFIQEINNFLIKENFVDKAIYVLNNMLEKILEENYQFIFNIMEYILYIISIFPNEIIDNKNKYIDFIYQFITKIFTEVELNKNTLYMFFGALQLSNRLIYVKACKNVIWEEFNIQVAKMVICIYKYIKDDANNISLNLLQKNIFQNLLSNLIKVFGINNEENKSKEISESIKDIFKDIKKMNKKIISYDSTHMHWLFFFNKITNDLHFYKLTSDEDKLRYEWTDKFEKKQIFYSINKEFNIKYFFLKIDPMIDE